MPGPPVKGAMLVLTIDTDFWEEVPGWHIDRNICVYTVDAGAKAVFIERELVLRLLPNGSSDFDDA